MTVLNKLRNTTKWTVMLEKVTHGAGEAGALLFSIYFSTAFSICFRFLFGDAESSSA
jgi:hypothetical protein